MIDIPITQENVKYFAVGSQGAPLASIKAGINDDMHTVPALIDTGADFIFGDPEWLNAVGAPVIGDAKINGQTSAKTHMVILSIHGHPKEYAFRVIGREMPDPDYTIILGRSFLKYCTFHYNGPTALHTLTFHPGSLPANILLL